MAIAALILSLLWVCGLGSVAAVVLGILALRQIRESGQQVGGRGLAISGIVIGALGIVGGILSLVLLVSAGDTIGGVFDCALDPDATEAEIERCVEDLLDDSIR